MDKVHKPRNLIGYYSEEMIKNNTEPRLTFRMKAYSMVIVALTCVLMFFLLSRKDVDITVLRASGMLYQEQPDGYISNLYNAEIINKTTQDLAFDLKPKDKRMKIKWIQDASVIKKERSETATFFLMIPADIIDKSTTNIELEVIKNKKILFTIKTNFLGPVK
jgi:polyferredoxin